MNKKNLKKKHKEDCSSKQKGDPLPKLVSSPIKKMNVSRPASTLKMDPLPKLVSPSTKKMNTPPSVKSPIKVNASSPSSSSPTSPIETEAAEITQQIPCHCKTSSPKESINCTRCTRKFCFKCAKIN